MKAQELHKKSRDELSSTLKELYEKIDEMRFLLHQRKVKNVKAYRAMRKDIARILTILHIKNL